MKTYQVYDHNGGSAGIVSTSFGMADAARKARSICDFPVLVEMTEKQGITIRELVDRKTQFECWLAGVIEEQVTKFEESMGVRVNAVGTHLIHDNEGNRVQVQVMAHLNINVIGE